LIIPIITGHPYLPKINNTVRKQRSIQKTNPKSGVNNDILFPLKN